MRDPDDSGHHCTPIAKVPTGIRGVDRILDGGLPAGRMTVVSGGPGAGKTVFALEFLYRRALEGEPGVFITFEESADAVRANALSLGWDLASLEQAGKFSVVHANIPEGMITSGDFDMQGLIAIIEGRSGALGAVNLAIDAVDIIMSVFADDRRRHEEFRRLQMHLSGMGLSVVLTLKILQQETVYPFLDYMADCMLHLDHRAVENVRTRRLRVVKYRGSGFLSNEHPFLISPKGMEVMPVSSVGLSTEVRGEKLSSGNAVLDGLLGGGIHRGSSVLLAGPSGIGKTTLACTFALEMCRRSENVLYYSLEESEQALTAGMRSPGLDLSSPAEKGLLRLASQMPESRGAQEHLAAVLREIETFAPRHVIFDALSACRRIGSHNAGHDLMVYLYTICRRRNITCLLLNQTETFSTLDSLTGGFDISSLTDTIIGLRYAHTGLELERRLIVLKSRGSAHSLRYHRLNITQSGIELSELSGG